MFFYFDEVKTTAASMMMKTQQPCQQPDFPSKTNICTDLDPALPGVDMLEPPDLVVLETGFTAEESEMTFNVDVQFSEHCQLKPASF